MTKSPPPITKSDRLSKAVEQARNTRTEWVIRPPGQSRNVNSMHLAEPAQRAIKYPKASTALRQHVVETREATKALPKFRLRVAPATDARNIKALEGPAPPRAYVVSRGPAPEPALQPSLPDAGARVPPQELTGIESVSDLGKIVRRARRRDGLSQAQLAAMAGTGRRFVSELEAGKPTMEFERLLKVCNALGVSLLAAIHP